MHTNVRNFGFIKKAVSLLLVTAFVVTNVAAQSFAPTHPSPAVHTNIEPFTTDLTQLGRNGRLSPNLNFDRDATRLIEMLGKGVNAQPVLIDESGIAAESAAKQLASRIAAGDAPRSLRDVSIGKLETSILFSNIPNRKSASEAATSILDAAIASNGSQILYIDDLASIADLGDAGITLINAAREGKLRIIGGNSPAAYAKFIASQPEAAEIFTRIDLNAAEDT